MHMESYKPTKWSRPALWQEALADKSVRCLLCPHACVLHPQQMGICRTRINYDGTLFTLAYGNPCSVGIDPIEKKPLFHFLPGSDIYSLSAAGCNFRCLNCQNSSISQQTPLQVPHVDISPSEVVLQALSRHAGSIAFTYTEPTVFYEYMLDIARIAREKGVKSVIVSNGYINEEPLSELLPWIDAANIDLKCFDDKVYRHLAGGELQPVLDTLRMVKAAGVWLEITNLLVPGYTDSPEQIQALCEWLAENGFADTPLHFSRFFPGYKLPNVLPTTGDALIRAKSIAEKAGIDYVYIGNSPDLHAENTCCPACRQTVVERVGYRVITNRIYHGRCGFCGEPITGVWN